jgi:DNA polymerase-3 subunit delta
MTFNALLKEIEGGKFRPVYLLHGPESYFIDRLAEAIEAHALTESEKAFNETILYGRDLDHQAVIDAARRYPMMAPRQLVVIREAQEMRTLQQLAAYAEKPSATTVLVICHKHKRFSAKSKLGKAAAANGIVFESKSLYDNKIPGWIQSYLSEHGYPVAPEATALLAEYLGSDLAKIANELDKLRLNLPAGSAVDVAAVEEHVGISKEYNVFELQKAIGLRDRVKAFRIVNYFTANPKKNPLPVILGSLYGYFAKLYKYSEVARRPEPEILKALGLRSGYFLKEYRAAARHYNRRRTERVIGILRDFDLKFKGVDFNTSATREGELLKEMVWRIFAA